MKIKKVFKEESNLSMEDIIKSILEENLEEEINNFFENLNIKDITL